MIIKDAFMQSLTNYNQQGYISSYWNEVEKSYTQSNRHYHTLTHLNNLMNELTPLKERFTNWDVVVFAIVYHDIVYNTIKKNNEEKSAALAVNRLKKINLPESLIVHCSQMILATKTHNASDEETNLFTDADLSILGADRESYMTYAQQVRREYSFYPDVLYKPGRRKVLEHFLTLENIFKTKEFNAKYESAARLNLEAEISLLSK